VKQGGDELGAPLPAQAADVDLCGSAVGKVAGHARLAKGAHAASLTRGLSRATRMSATRFDTV
jgi:hypothetical protein